MTADEIRNFQLEPRDPEQAITGNVQDCAFLLREIGAQLAEANAINKPRWVNISPTSSPCLIDANRVASVNASTQTGTDGVVVTVRGIRDSFMIHGLDHDEVRGLLGIGEDWMNPIAKPPTGGRYMTEADYAEAMEIVDTARKLSNDKTLVAAANNLDAAENLAKLDRLFDSFDSLPF